MKYIVLIFTALAYAGSALASPKTIPKLTDLKSLSTPQKLGLLTLSQLQPKKYGNLQLTRSSLFADDDLPYVDYFFMDIRTLLVQSIKVEETARLPEINWTYHFELCIVWFCIEDQLTLTTENTRMIGQKDTISVNTVTPTNFTNSFHVPSFIYRSPGFLFNITDIPNGDQTLYRDFYLGINNLKLETSADYSFVEELGIQISNLTIDFSIGYMRANIENVTAVYPDGTVEVYDPVKTDYTEYLQSDWDSYKDHYLESLQFRINCFLSGSRNDPERCETSSGYVNTDYYKMNVLQFIETIGLGSLDRY